MRSSVNENTRTRSESAVPAVRVPWREGTATGSDTGLLISYTEYRFDHYYDVPRIVLAALRMRNWWSRLDGAVGLSLYLRPRRRTVGSLSAWQAQPDQRAFVGERYHVEIMRRFRSRGTLRSVSWELPPGRPFDLVAAYAEAEDLIAAGEVALSLR